MLLWLRLHDQICRSEPIPTVRHNRRMMEHFGDAGISYLDLLPVLTGEEQPTYFDDDPHTYAFGHRLIAEALVERIAPLLREAVSVAGDGVDESAG